MLLAEAEEAFFRFPVIQREKAMISSNIFYQLRSDVAPRAPEETRPSSIRPVLLLKLSFPVLPNPKFPDNHVHGHRPTVLPCTLAMISSVTARGASS